jgi:hypothetical protein
MAFDRAELKRLLLNGESLEVTTSGGQYEVWAEPYANPPVVYYEGHISPLDQVDAVIGAMPVGRSTRNAGEKLPGSLSHAGR